MLILDFFSILYRAPESSQMMDICIRNLLKLDKNNCDWIDFFVVIKNFPS